MPPDACFAPKCSSLHTATRLFQHRQPHEKPTLALSMMRDGRQLRLCVIIFAPARILDAFSRRRLGADIISHVFRRLPSMRDASARRRIVAFGFLCWLIISACIERLNSTVASLLSVISEDERVEVMMASRAALLLSRPSFTARPMSSLSARPLGQP